MEIWEKILNREYKISKGPESRRKKCVRKCVSVWLEYNE